MCPNYNGVISDTKMELVLGLKLDPLLPVLFTNGKAQSPKSACLFILPSATLGHLLSTAECQGRSSEKIVIKSFTGCSIPSCSKK